MTADEAIATFPPSIEKDSVKSSHLARPVFVSDPFVLVTTIAYFLYASVAFTMIVWTFDDVTGFTSDQLTTSVQVKESLVAYTFAEAGYC
jgi:hypothetical protein